MPKLKPCPFCGGKAELKKGIYNPHGVFGSRSEDKYCYRICCSNCLITQPKRRYFTYEEAVKDWNTRADYGMN